MPESLFTKAAAQRPEACNVIKTRLWHRCFPVHFAQCLRTSFYRKAPNGCFCNEVEKTLQFRRSSLLKVLCKKEVLRNFVNSQEHACTRVSFWIKVQSWGTVLIKTFINTVAQKDYANIENKSFMFNCFG